MTTIAQNIEKQQYTRTAISLHWLMAALFIGMFVLGFYMKNMPFSPKMLQLYSWHKWAGISIFLLVLFRLAWRVSHRAPALPNTMSPTMQFLAHAGHWALYGFMLAVPLTGWLMSSAMGVQTVWFGVAPIPDLIPESESLADFFSMAHLVLNVAFILAIVGHVAAALRHQFIDKDDLFSRLSWRRQKQSIANK